MTSLALVVENDAGTRKLLEAMLRRLDLEVDPVAAPSAALALLETVPYDLVLLELLFPGSDGSEVLAWLEQHRPDVLQRTVVITSAPRPHLRKIESRWPAVRGIQKPFELQDLLEIARSAAAGPERSTGAAFEQFVRRSVRAGAKAAVILAADGAEARAVAAFGYRPETLAPFLPLRIDTNVPLSDAIRSGTSIWIAALGPSADRYAHLVDLWRNNESRALCAVPVTRDGAVIGAVGFSFREPHLFGETEQQAFIALAQLAADVIESGT